MTFKHKLSKRLAMTRDLVVAAAAATIVACSLADEPNLPKTSLLSSSATPGTVLFQENFEDNAFAGRGWYDNAGMTLTDTGTLAGSTHALEAHFRAGAQQPTWGGAARHLFAGRLGASVSPA